MQGTRLRDQCRARQSRQDHCRPKDDGKAGARRSRDLAPPIPTRRSRRSSSSAANPVYNAPSDLEWAELQKTVANCDPPRLARGRDRRAFHVARAAGALSRKLGRRPRDRWQLHRRAADDPAALRRLVGARSAREDRRPHEARGRRAGPGDFPRDPPKPAISPRRGRSSSTTASSKRAPRPTPRLAFNAAAASPYIAENTTAPALAGGRLRGRLRPCTKSMTAATTTTAGSRKSPIPITKLTWDNAALISPATREEARASRTGDMIEVTIENRKLEIPVLIAPGHADNSHHHPARLRPQRGRPGRHGDRLQRLPAAHQPAALLRWSARACASTGEHLPLAHHAGARRARRPRRRPHARGSTPARSHEGRHDAGSADALLQEDRAWTRHIPKNVSLYNNPPLTDSVPVGHGHRPERLHRLLGVHGRLPGGEQHPDRRQGAGHRRPRDALDSHATATSPADDENDPTIPRWSRSR